MPSASIDISKCKRAKSADMPRRAHRTSRLRGTTSSQKKGSSCSVSEKVIESKSELLAFVQSPGWDLRGRTLDPDEPVEVRIYDDPRKGPRQGKTGKASRVLNSSSRLRTTPWRSKATAVSADNGATLASAARAIDVPVPRFRVIPSSVNATAAAATKGVGRKRRAPTLALGPRKQVPALPPPRHHIEAGSGDARIAPWIQSANTVVRGSDYDADGEDMEFLSSLESETGAALELELLEALIERLERQEAFRRQNESSVTSTIHLEASLEDAAIRSDRLLKEADKVIPPSAHMAARARYRANFREMASCSGARRRSSSSDSESSEDDAPRQQKDIPILLTKEQALPVLRTRVGTFVRESSGSRSSASGSSRDVDGQSFGCSKGKSPVVSDIVLGRVFQYWKRRRQSFGGPMLRCFHAFMMRKWKRMEDPLRETEDLADATGRTVSLDTLHDTRRARESLDYARIFAEGVRGREELKRQALYVATDLWAYANIADRIVPPPTTAHPRSRVASTRQSSRHTPREASRLSTRGRVAASSAQKAEVEDAPAGRIRSGGGRAAASAARVALSAMAAAEAGSRCKDDEGPADFGGGSRSRRHERPCCEADNSTESVRVSRKRACAEGRVTSVQDKNCCDPAQDTDARWWLDDVWDQFANLRNTPGELRGAAMGGLASKSEDAAHGLFAYRGRLSEGEEGEQETKDAREAAHGSDAGRSSRNVEQRRRNDVKSIASQGQKPSMASFVSTAQELKSHGRSEGRSRQADSRENTVAAAASSTARTTRRASRSEEMPSLPTTREDGLKPQTRKHRGELDEDDCRMSSPTLMGTASSSDSTRVRTRAITSSVSNTSSEGVSSQTAAPRRRSESLGARSRSSVTGYRGSGIGTYTARGPHGGRSEWSVCHGSRARPLKAGSS